jgi:hypothetical protein
MARTVIAALMAAATTMGSETVSGQARPATPVRPATGNPLYTTNPVLQASLDRIAEGSALWREAIDAIRSTRRQALIVTPNQVTVTDAIGRTTLSIDAGVLAEVTPVSGPDSRVNRVVVVVNLPLLEQVHQSKGSLPGEFYADLDRILVHEIYGHAVPYLIAGNLSARCPDPQPDERAHDACAIRRENAVRAELRLGRRVDGGLEGLALSRRGLH